MTAFPSSFRFRLERVRSLRERREDVAKQELAAALARRLRSEQELEAAEQRMADAREQQLDATTSLTGANDLVARQAYLERTEQAHRATREDLEQRDSELSDSRDALSEAARDREALERLKEQRRAEHEREMARIEGLALDEIAIHRFHRRAA